MDARFILACSDPAQLPPPSLTEVGVAGRSNCGKSSLINAVCGQHALARISSTPGRTRQLVFFLVTPAQGEPFHLVDLPGYGYARVSRTQQQSWARLVNDYIDHRPTLRALLLLCDIRREPGQEEHDLITWAVARELDLCVVLTKADKLNKSQRFAAASRAKAALSLTRRPQLFSMHDGKAVASVREELLGLAGEPKQV